MKDFVPHKESLELKALGFEELVFAKHQKMSEDARYQLQLLAKERNCNILDTAISAPTFSQAFKFFREKYGLHLTLHLNSKGYYTTISKKINNLTACVFSSEMYSVFEEAELECLKKLIEIVKK